jgi:hypothetical protein
MKAAFDRPVSIEYSVVDSIRTGSHEMLVRAEGNIDWSGIDFLRL